MTIRCADVAIITASILDADYSRLEHEVTRVSAAGVDAFSLDVMDGHFAPRITFGDYLVARIRDWTDRPIEIHLMVERPETWVTRMCDAGADMIVFHLEAARDPLDVVERVRAERRSVGVALTQETAVDELSDDLLAEIDLVNLLAVPVGFGGGTSAGDTFERIAALRGRAETGGHELGIEVDGGVKPATAPDYVRAGADMLTVGTGIYRAPDVEEAVRTLRESTRGPEDERARRRLRHFLSVPSATPVDDAARRARLEGSRALLDVPPTVWAPAGPAR